MLSRREHTRRELLDKLIQRGFEAVQVEQIIQELNDANLQSDERFATLFAEHRSNKGFGALKIRADLHNRGIDSALAEQTLTNLSIDWVTIAHRVAERKFRQLNGETPNNSELMKCKRFLGSRGFGYAQISDAIKLLIK